jgi:molybdopterin/thiamine biosynthesis adenylyltransferase
MERKLAVTICGAGTLGGNLAENLARAGLGSLTVIDRDRVEERNCANQPYGLLDVGQPKVRSLAELLHRSVRARITAVHRELTEGNAERLLSGAGLVIDVFDNEGSRRILKEVCGRLNLPCLHAGLSTDGYGEVIWNERYTVPPEASGDPCDLSRARNLSLLVVAAATRSIDLFLEQGLRRSFTITEKDLRIEALE